MAQTAMSHGTIVDHGDCITEPPRPDLTGYFVDMSAVAETGDMPVSHDTVVMPDGTVHVRINDKYLGPLLDRY